MSKLKDKDVKVIGICGPAQAGKDTAGRFMAQQIINSDDYNMQEHVVALESFAAPIKSMVAMLLDFHGYGSVMNPDKLNVYLEGDQKEEVLDRIGVSTRRLMQTIGTEWGREMIKDSIWLDCMEGRIGQFDEAKKHGHPGAIVIITDVRFDNEAEMIKRNGGVIVRIDSDRDTIPEHASEAGVSECLVDTVIDNSDDIDTFYARVLSYLEGLLECKLYEEPVSEEATGNEKD